MAATAHAASRRPILVDLRRHADARITAPNSYSAGGTVAGVGDVNGDGRPDFSVGSEHGAYVIFGGPTMNRLMDLERRKPGDGIRIANAKAADRAGDVNGDGISDLAVVGPSGADSIVFGSPDIQDLDVAALPPGRGFQIRPGGALASAGDVNGDGLNDLIVGLSGAPRGDGVKSGVAYVVYGRRDGGDVDLAAMSPAAGIRIEGAQPNDLFGAGVAAAGDVNGDGRPDLLIGAPDAHRGATRAGDYKGEGAAYVIYTRPGMSSVEARQLPPDGGFRIDGAATFGTLGASLAGLGDVNGDGLADIAVSAPTAGPRGPYTNGPGITYFIYGSRAGATIDTKHFVRRQGFIVTSLYAKGNDAVEGLGGDLDAGGDVNGDGHRDFILGGGSSDYSAVVYGTSRPQSILNLYGFAPEQGFGMTGTPRSPDNGDDLGDIAGASVAIPGDLNGDGLADVIVGAPGEGEYEGPSGAYVLFGQNTGPTLSGVTASRRVPRRGRLALSYTLSVPAAVRLTLRRRHSKRLMASLTFPAGSGRHRTALDARRFVGHGSLTRGPYRLEVVAIARSGRRSATVTKLLHVS